MMISTPPYLTIDIKSFLPEILRGTSVTQIEMAQQGRTYQAQKYWGGTKFLKTLGGLGACSPWNILNIEVLRCNLVDFRGFIKNYILTLERVSYIAFPKNLSESKS